MKLKLVAVLFLAITAIISVGYISYLGLTNLMTTLEETVKPDYREEKLQKLLYHISEAENGIRIYTITREYKYLHSYFDNNKKTDTLIQSLKANSLSDLYLIHSFDTIQQLINQKIRIQNRLIRLKQDQKRINVYEEVLNKIQDLERKNAVFDSLENAIEEAEFNLEKEILIKEQELTISENEMVDEKQGILKKIFGQGKKAQQEQLAQQENLLVKERELDTLIATKDTLSQIIDTIQKENLTAEVEQSLAEIKLKEETINRELTIAELILTRRDKNFSSAIQGKVARVQSHFDQIDMNQAKEASSFFSNITNLIKVIGSISSMIFLVLVFIIFNDIKINQRYRKQLEKSKQKAEDLAQAKNDFLSNMSHEIRTPMNAILGFAEQLNSASLNNKEKKQLGIIQNASQHLLSIINDILDFAKIEAGKIKLEKIPFYVPDNAQIVYDTLYQSAMDKNLHFDLEIEDQIKEHNVKGDPVRFRQILFNLAGNAIKFTKEGFVKIKIDHDFRHIIIKVMDSGIGIEKESISLIFKKFDQANQETSKKYGGTGLGLAIVKKLVEMQKGTISVKSEKNQGTEFTVKLPYIPAETHEKREESKDESMLAGKLLPDHINVLLVDDEEYNLLLLENILSNHSIPFQSAQSGSKAIELFSKHTFTIAFIDVQMDEMDGLETTRVIRDQFNSTIPIIAATASATEDTKKKCLAAGMDEILIKPISEQAFLELIKKHSKDSSDLNHQAEPTPSRKIEQETNNQHEIKDEIINEGFQEIERLFQDNKEMAISMTNIYYKSIQELIDRFTSYNVAQDLKKIKADAHRLMPSTRHMGFIQHADNLKTLEKCIDQNEELPKIEKLVEKIVRDSKTILEKLDEFLAVSQQ